ncbi:dephospho-CoA kinase [Natronospira bacteriovora]|uniref:Dephospho-CoA kinase n=1 Tax=Natronospira bacteriovora TaxID=3069753 RepID=A0ABU0W6W0_9GAMM|nr:dephospho-CoA kinase [Natronospira sp. AB-CW4]MDQ2069493.1 dephospho-CoA kinase [Natronospira sp. AB-CW4]
MREKPRKAPFKVALTGGAGSGKSAVAARLREKGVTVIDTDQLARTVVAPGSEGLEAVVGAFGSDVLDDDGQLDRRRLRERILGDASSRRQLEAILHPRIMAALASAMEAADGAYVVAEIPLLVESGHAGSFDHVVTVEAPMATRLKRMMARDGVTEPAARALIDAQASTEQRCAIADSVIENDGTLAALNEQVDALHHRLVQLGAPTA